MPRRYFITFLILLFSGGVMGQSFPLLNYTTENGLPSNIVYDIFTDSKGYIWMGTDKGVARFNGNKYTIYTTSDGLPDNEVFTFMEDYQGRIWVFAFKGTLCYFKDNKFYTAADKPWMALPPGKGVFSNRFLQEEDSTLIGISADNLSFVVIKQESLKFYPLAKLYSKQPGLEWILHIRKLSEKTFRIWYLQKYIDVDTNMNVLSELAHPWGVSYQPIYDGIHPRFLYNHDGIYTMKGRKVHSFPKKEKLPSNIKALNYDQDLFVCVDSTLTVNNRTLLSNIYTTGLCRDFSGNYWISTKGGGIYYLSKHLLNISRYPDVYEGRVRAAGIFNNNLTFVSDHDHFYKLPAGAAQVQRLYTNPDYISPEKNRFHNSSYLITDSVSYFRLHDLVNFQLHIRPDGKAEKKQIDKLWWNKKEQVARTIKDVKKDGNDLYFFTISSLLHINYDRLFEKDIYNKLDTIISTKDDRDNRIAAKAIDERDHSIWLSRADGVFKVKDGKVTRLPPFGNINFRQFEFMGNYLVGRTDDNKLLVCNTGNQHVTIDTLVDKDCIWENIYLIDQYHAIIVTNNHNRLLSLYPVAPGAKPSCTLKIIESPFLPQEAEYVKADAAFCYFFEKGTVTRISTRLLFAQTTAPISVFSSFKVKNKSYPISPQITIPYSESKGINITFDNISYISKEVSSEYAIVENGKEEWINVTGNEINLNATGFGNYIIKVRAKTLSSNYSKPAVLRLTILRPFWATWWFIALCILALIALVWAIVLLVTWRKLLKKQKEHEADMKYQQSEYKALNALMNPHFIFNSLNNIQGLINKDEKRIANEYLVIFSDLVRQNMHNISKGFISLQQELNLVENYLTLEKLRFKELVNYEMKVEEEVETEVIMIPPLMIQPLVENAVKHGLLPRESVHSMVRICVYERDNRLYIEIADNGIGLTRSLQSKNRLYESFGLSNLKKRTEHLKKIQQHDINIEVTETKDQNGNSTGTKAMITMELGPS